MEENRRGPIGRKQGTGEGGREGDIKRGRRGEREKGSEGEIHVYTHRNSSFTYQQTQIN